MSEESGAKTTVTFKAATERVNRSIALLAKFIANHANHSAKLSDMMRTLLKRRSLLC